VPRLRKVPCRDKFYFSRAHRGLRNAVIAMQYAFSFPAGFDMTQIRRRVAERGAAFDNLPGLVQKAFLIREQSGRHSEGVNEYAPFYVWHDGSAMLDFLAGDKFRAVTQAFGWVSVRSWNPLAYGVADLRGRGATGAPQYATLETVPVPADTDLGTLRETEVTNHRRATAESGVHSRVVALDASRWELVRFTLWQQSAAAENGIDLSGPGIRGYEVLHLSAPGANAADAGAGEPRQT
jgi:hypothetical protein